MSAWVAVDGGFSVPAETPVVALLLLLMLWLALQRSLFILSSQAESRISFGSMVLSFGLAYETDALV